MVDLPSPALSVLDDRKAAVITEILDDALVEIEEHQTDPFGAIIGYVFGVAVERYGEAGLAIVEANATLQAAQFRNVLANLRDGR